MKKPIEEHSPMVLWLLVLWQGPAEESGLPNLVNVFLEGDRSAFSALLSEEMEIKTDLRPLLYDHGKLNRQQVLMGFDKLLDRYRVANASVLNSQSDTNYAWLEFFIRLGLEEKKTGLVYQVGFSFHFKIAGSRMAISRWALQDIY